jgi:hypothetical protein
VIWPFRRYSNGYCTIRMDGKVIVASRVLCRMVHGEPPTPAHEAAHSCGRGEDGCINPRHLRWMTPTENQAERVIHGTANRGIRHGMAKLDDSTVLEICRRLKRGEAQTSIAADYGVSQTAISEINTGKCWGWLTGVSA